MIFENLKKLQEGLDVAPMLARVMERGRSNARARAAAAPKPRAERLAFGIMRLPRGKKAEAVEAPPAKPVRRTRTEPAKRNVGGIVGGFLGGDKRRPVDFTSAFGGKKG